MSKAVLTFSGTQPTYDAVLEFNIPKFPGISPNYDNIRFLDMNGRELPFWIEHDENGKKNGYCYVKVPWIGEDGISIIMQWGPGVEGRENGDEVFLLFDDFDDALSKWNIEPLYSTHTLLDYEQYNSTVLRIYNGASAKEHSLVAYQNKYLPQKRLVAKFRNNKQTAIVGSYSGIYAHFVSFVDNLDVPLAYNVNSTGWSTISGYESAYVADSDTVDGREIFPGRIRISSSTDGVVIGNPPLDTWCVDYWLLDNRPDVSLYRHKRILDGSETLIFSADRVLLDDTAQLVWGSDYIINWLIDWIVVYPTADASLRAAFMLPPSFLWILPVESGILRIINASSITTVITAITDKQMFYERNAYFNASHPTTALTDARLKITHEHIKTAVADIVFLSHSSIAYISKQLWESYTTRNVISFLERILNSVPNTLSIAIVDQKPSELQAALKNTYDINEYVLVKNTSAFRLLENMVTTTDHLLGLLTKTVVTQKIDNRYADTNKTTIDAQKLYNTHTYTSAQSHISSANTLANGWDNYHTTLVYTKVAQFLTGINYSLSDVIATILAQTTATTLLTNAENKMIPVRDTILNALRRSTRTVAELSITLSKIWKSHEHINTGALEAQLLSLSDNIAELQNLLVSLETNNSIANKESFSGITSTLHEILTHLQSTHQITQQLIYDIPATHTTTRITEASSNVKIRTTRELETTLISALEKVREFTLAILRTLAKVV